MVEYQFENLPFYARTGGEPVITNRVAYKEQKETMLIWYYHV